MADEILAQTLSDIRAGKKEAFDRLLALVQGTVFSFGMKVCGQVEDARDTMQDTLLRAFQSLPQTEFKDSRALKVWLYKVAKNACLMMRRKGKFEPRQMASIEELMPETIHQDHSKIGDWSGLPVNTLLKKEAAETIHAAIAKIPVPYRLVLVLRDMEQLSTKETATVLKISEETVKIRLHRARLYLRNELEKTMFKKKR